MKIECHILQNFPPHCLNRDDTNSPKDCEFGGVRRARISSQCLKRAVRDAFDRYHWIPADQQAVRTKRIIEQVAALLVEQKRTREDATEATLVLLESVKLTADRKEGSEPKTQYLLFLPKKRIQQLAALVAEQWDALMGVVEARRSAATEAKEAKEQPAVAKGKKAKASKKAAKGDVDLPKEAIAQTKHLLKDATATPELALFGRMIADNADWNVDAACQVAHAISTNRVTMDFDFFTAVDDLRGDTETGSDMMGTVQFNSSCFYRYAVVDYEQLKTSLGGEESELLARSTVEAFLKAFVSARPSGKQNSMAANTLPSVVLVSVRDKGDAVSLANAFVKPVAPRERDADDLVAASAKRLAEHLGQMTRMYPSSLRGAFACSLETVPWPERPEVQTTDSVDGLVQLVVDQLKPGAGAA